jgi:hypothetical protein|uniref:Uncharacterized protein n=1 Tax=Panagrolaimus davidi TaxID=227884 RepID=A0A914PF44_9BILA
MAHLFNIIILFLLAVICLFAKNAEADNSRFFSRDVKWANLPPSGGSLVSGRGNFRPGFYGTGPIADSRAYISEPLFAFKRSSQWTK